MPSPVGSCGCPRVTLQGLGSSSPARPRTPERSSKVSQNAADSRPQPGSPGIGEIPVVAVWLLPVDSEPPELPVVESPVLPEPLPEVTLPPEPFELLEPPDPRSEEHTSELQSQS